ncbi:WD40 region of Ge1, enhancer of mRNA-decapping protein [Nitzschia inconspicua]|uniref:WD40 region of Ge1, enhancer of mRNA-decapping protein n=1 Tax=Nitzschia inconspicua TaxID=303405 RepID=A0A9K3KVM7_9STRA|nr:WD40 region of Ge1, enhancer of mRNA-decapping protein [Nitzschia inconspicua]
MATASYDEEPFGTTPLPTSTAEIGGGGSGTTPSGDDAAASGIVSSPVEIVLDMDPVVDPINGIAQQPQTQQIAVYEPTPNEDCINGCLLDVNPHFVVYAVKNGLIRILHRHSAMRALLRGHSGQRVTDIRFFLDGDVLGTIGSKGADSTLIVWRVFEQSPEIQSEKLLEISSSSLEAPDLIMSRLVWHPFNPNQFWMMHSTPTVPQVATLVETTRIQTRLSEPNAGTDGAPLSQHAICQWHSPYCVMDGALRLQTLGGKLTDLAWSGRDARHVVTVHDNGTIILWDLKQKGMTTGHVGTDSNEEGVGDEDVTLPKKLCVLQEGGVPYSRCCFLPHEQAAGREADLSTSLTTCFVTASHQNSVVTLWSAFSVAPASDGNAANNQPQYQNPTKLQVIHMVPDPLATVPTSFVMDVCYGPAPPNAAPPSCFLLLASRQSGRLFALHCRSVWSTNQLATPTPQNQRALCVGVDYLVPFALKYPVYSWSVVCSPTQDIAEEEIGERAGLIFDMKCFSYQSNLVQCLTLTSYMCLPPEHAYKQNGYKGILKVQPLSGKYVASESNGNGDHLSAVSTSDPEYDEDYDVGDDDAEDVEAEAPAPSSGGLFPASSTLAQNPFANWLGAIASGTAPTTDPPLPPVPMATAPTGMEAAAPPLLNPMDILAGTKEEAIKPPPATESSKQKKKTKGRSKSPSLTQNSKRSRSPKVNKNQDKNTFPDGKVTILKRDAKAAPSGLKEAPPLPPDPSLVSDPAIFAAAGIPMPPPPTTSPAPVASFDMAALESQVSNAVENSMANVVVPVVSKAIQESFANLARPLRTSMDNLSKQGVTVNQDALKTALNIETPLKAALADNMRNVLVPTLESVVGQVLQQIQRSMPPPPPDQSKALELVMQQLASMSAKMDALTKEVQVLRTAVSAQTSANAIRGPSPQHPQSAPGSGGPPMDAPATQEMQLEQLRHSITSLLQEGKFEAAFTKAVSASTADMTLFCCSRADITKVFGGTAPTLSQPIMLCVMQQLGAALAKTSNPADIETELSWLQEIALSLNPREPSIQRHVPAVLQQLVTSINARIVAEGNNGNVQLRRPLQMLLQVLRGMQLG